MTERFQRRLATLRDRAGQGSADAWEQLGSWNRADIERFFNSTDTLFSAARRSAVNASAGYYQLVTDAPVVAVDLTIAAQVDAPFHAYWAALKDGAMWADAFDVGTTRAEAVGTDLVTGASREVATLANPDGIAGWRRVLTGDSCDWCGDVARQRYKTVDSATFGHDHCDCIVVPIYGDRDPGQVVNARHLEQVSADVPGIRV